MHHASLFTGFIFAEQTVEPGIAVGMHGAGVTGKVVDGMLTLAIHAELIPRTRWGIATPSAFIAHITPQPCSLGLLCLEFGLQLYRRIVGKKRRTRPDQLADMICQRFQQGRAASHPICECGAVQLNLFSGQYLGVPLKGQMVAVFANENMRQKAWAGTTPFNWSRG